MSVVNPVNVEHSTAGWIAEDFVGPVGKEACTALVSQSGTNLSRPVARIVTSYLEKPAKVDVPQLRAGHPGLNLDLGNEVCVSFEVEQLLQMDLDQVIKDDEALQRYKALECTKVTHVTTLFFKARGMSLLDLNPLNCSVRVDQNSLRNLPKDIWTAQEECNQWIVKLDEPVGYGKTEEEQNALVPKGAEVTSFVDHNFTIFARSCYPANAMAPIHYASTRCKEKDEENASLCVDYYDNPEEHPSPIYAFYYSTGSNAAGVQWKFPAVGPAGKPAEKTGDKRAAGA